MCNNFDKLFKMVIKKTSGATLFQMDCILHEAYMVNRQLINSNGYDEETFFSLVYHADTKLKDDVHVKKLVLSSEKIIEKYNRGYIYGINSAGLEYRNHFKRNNDGFWDFSWYEAI